MIITDTNVATAQRVEELTRLFQDENCSKMKVIHEQPVSHAPRVGKGCFGRSRFVIRKEHFYLGDSRSSMPAQCAQI